MILDRCWVIFICTFSYVHMAGVDHTHGSYFVFPAPFCDKFHQVQAVVRWKYGARFRTVVTLHGAYKKYIQSMGEEFPKTPLPCVRLNMGAVTKSAALIAESKEEVMLYVQYKHDNFLVYPAVFLQNNYKIITPFPEGMDKTFLTVTTSTGMAKLKVKLSPNLTAFVEYNELPYYPGEIIHVNLGRRDVLMLSCFCDLSGTFVESTSNIAVISGAYKNSFEKELLIEPSFPLKSWGKNFVLPIEYWMYNITLKIAGKEDVINGLEISTENATEYHQRVHGMFIYNVEAQEHVIIHSTSSFHVVCHIEFAEEDIQRPIITNGVPVEQYPKFLCPSFTSTRSTTCFAGIGNVTYFQSMFLDPVVDVTSPWFIAVVKKEGQLAFVPEFKHVWSYSPRIVQEGDTTVFYSGASRLTRLYDDCVRDPPARIGINDGVDNDCDGIVDEEVNDNEDNDIDLKVDEDTSSNFAICVMDYNYGHTTKPWIFLTTSMIAVLISICSALIGVALFIGGNFLIELLQGGHPSRPSRVEPAD